MLEIAKFPFSSFSYGVSERVIFIIDKKEIIRYINIHDINSRPKLEVLIKEMEKLED